jgi:recombination protein RecT
MSTTPSSQLSTDVRTVKDYLALASYRDRFSEVLKSRAPQFMAAITQVSQLPALRDAEPRSIIAAAMTAATLDLPINPTLGQAHIIAYADGERKVAQFQIGYKGLIQLALRSGQYKRLNAGPVHGKAFKGYDIVGEPVLDFNNYDPAAEITGYFCAFETRNGFQKVVYWTKEQVEAHAKRFSRAYQKGYRSSPWFSDFDSMATKTVVKSALTKWGILSVEMQRAAVHDQGVQDDIDADVRYADGEDIQGDAAPAGNATPAESPAPRPEPRKPRKGVSAAADPKPVTPAAPAQTVEPDGPRTDPAPEPEPAKPEAAPAPKPEPAKEAPKAAAPAEPAPKPSATPRAFLNDKELIETVVKVTRATPLQIKKGDNTYASVQAEVTGGFVGVIYHVGGGLLDGDKPVLNEPWAPGAELRVSLLGTLNSKIGKVQTFVQKVALANPEATGATEGAMEV